MRIAIVGAGVFGSGAALELARRGHAVTLCDPGPVPHPHAASTDISKVVRLDYGGDGFYTELMERALARWRALSSKWDRPLFHETGFLLLSSQPLRPGSFEHDSLMEMERRGHPVERGRRPVLVSDRFVDGYYNPQGGWAESGEVVRRFVAEASEAGVVTRFGQRVALDGETLRFADGSRLEADTVVVAAGAWTPALVPELADRMKPVGQPVFLFAPPRPERFAAPELVPWAADIARTGWYGLPVTPHGIVKVANHGTGLAMDPSDPPGVSVDGVAACREFLADAIPALANAPLAGTRVCPYCDSVDGDFWITRHRERERLVIAAGGSGHAFKFAPILGELVADEVEGQLHPALAARWGWRTPNADRGETARAR